MDLPYDPQDDPDAPECSGCGEPYHPRRAQLGYDRCLACSAANQGPPSVVIADVSKSNPIVTRDPRYLSEFGRQGRSELVARAPMMNLSAMATAQDAEQVRKDPAVKWDVRDAVEEDREQRMADKRRGVKFPERK